MKLKDFGLLTDQNIHPHVVLFLRTSGFNVCDVKEHGWFGHGDAFLLQHATAENRLVVTHDADFGTLTVFSGMQAVGIVYLRPGHIDAQFTIATIKSLLETDPDVTPPFVLVAKRTGPSVAIRIRYLGP